MELRRISFALWISTAGLLSAFGTGCASAPAATQVAMSPTAKTTTAETTSASTVVQLMDAQLARICITDPSACGGQASASRAAAPAAPEMQTIQNITSSPDAPASPPAEAKRRSKPLAHSAATRPRRQLEVAFVAQRTTRR